MVSVTVSERTLLPRWGPMTSIGCECSIDHRGANMEKELPVVAIGCRVQVRDHNGLLSWYYLFGGQRGGGWVPVYSALGVALLGKRVGDRVLPRGAQHELEILALAPISLDSC